MICPVDAEQPHPKAPRLSNGEALSLFTFYKIEKGRPNRAAFFVPD
jgi:hypothetical protein